MRFCPVIYTGASEENQGMIFQTDVTRFEPSDTGMLIS
jgi:hypothetical protein